MRHERREKQKAESRNMSKNREEFSSFGCYWLCDSCVFVCSNSALEFRGGHYGQSPGKFSLGGESPRANRARACPGRETLYLSLSIPGMINQFGAVYRIRLFSRMILYHLILLIISSFEI